MFSLHIYFLFLSLSLIRSSSQLFLTYPLFLSKHITLQLFPPYNLPTLSLYIYIHIKQTNKRRVLFLILLWSPGKKIRFSSVHTKESSARVCYLPCDVCCQRSVYQSVCVCVCFSIDTQKEVALNMCLLRILIRSKRKEREGEGMKDFNY